MAKNRLKELAKYEQKVALLKKELDLHQRRLLALPAKVGLRSVGELIKALQAAAGGGAQPAGKTKPARRKRAKITPEMKARLKELAGAGKTGGQIARALGISLPSVHNIKKELGLVKKRR